jgi:hypothetical protein
VRDKDSHPSKATGGIVVLSILTFIFLDNNFKYLGSVVESTGREKMEISHRTEKGERFYMMKGIIWKWDIPKAAKVLLYKTYQYPVVTYGAETWVWSKKDQSRMQAAEMNFLHNTEK